MKLASELAQAIDLARTQCRIIDDLKRGSAKVRAARVVSRTFAINQVACNVAAVLAQHPSFNRDQFLTDCGVIS